MGETEFGKRPKIGLKGFPKIVPIIILGLTVAGGIGAITIYTGVASDSEQIEQVQELRKEMDSLSNRGYQLQHKIDSLNRLGVADFQPKDSVTTKLNVPDSNRP